MLGAVAGYLRGGRSGGNIPIEYWETGMQQQFWSWEEIQRKRTRGYLSSVIWI